MWNVKESGWIIGCTFHIGFIHIYYAFCNYLTYHKPILYVRNKVIINIITIVLHYLQIQQIYVVGFIDKIIILT